MRKIISQMHVSMDGFVARESGALNWVKLDEEIFQQAHELTLEATIALYGRKTWQIMDDYWPDAAEKPGASWHDKQYTAWYNSVDKFVLSRTMEGTRPNKVNFFHEDPIGFINRLKEQPEKNIQIFGSPPLVQLLSKHKMIDEYWLLINPVILGKGIPLFGAIGNEIGLKLAGVREYSIGVTVLHYLI